MLYTAIGFFENEVLLLYSERNEASICEVSREEFIQKISDGEIEQFVLKSNKKEPKYLAVDMSKIVNEEEMYSILPSLSQVEYNFLTRNLNIDKQGIRHRPRAFVDVLHVNFWHIRVKIAIDSWDLAFEVADELESYGFDVGVSLHKTGALLVNVESGSQLYYMKNVLEDMCDVLWDTSFAGNDFIVHSDKYDMAPKHVELFKEFNNETLTRLEES